MGIVSSRVAPGPTIKQYFEGGDRQDGVVSAITTSLEEDFKISRRTDEREGSVGRGGGFQIPYRTTQQNAIPQKKKEGKNGREGRRNTRGVRHSDGGFLRLWDESARGAFEPLHVLG